MTDENEDEDEDEDDDADMRLSFWRILRHKKPKQVSIAQKTMAETVKRSIHTNRAHDAGYTPEQLRQAAWLLGLSHALKK